MGYLDGMAEGITMVLLGMGAIVICGGVAIGASIGACILAATLYACGCLVCPQHDNHDIPMDIIQSDLESVGNDSDLAEAI